MWKKRLVWNQSCTYGLFTLLPVLLFTVVALWKSKTESDAVAHVTNIKMVKTASHLNQSEASRHSQNVTLQDVKSKLQKMEVQNDKLGKKNEALKISMQNVEESALNLTSKLLLKDVAAQLSENENSKLRKEVIRLRKLAPNWAVNTSQDDPANNVTENDPSTGDLAAVVVADGESSATGAVEVENATEVVGGEGELVGITEKPGIVVHDHNSTTTPLSTTTQTTATTTTTIITTTTTEMSATARGALPVIVANKSVEPSSPAAVPKLSNSSSGESTGPAEIPLTEESFNLTEIRSDLENIITIRTDDVTTRPDDVTTRTDDVEETKLSSPVLGGGNETIGNPAGELGLDPVTNITSFTREQNETSDESASVTPVENNGNKTSNVVQGSQTNVETANLTVNHDNLPGSSLVDSLPNTQTATEDSLPLAKPSAHPAAVESLPIAAQPAAAGSDILPIGGNSPPVVQPATGDGLQGVHPVSANDSLPPVKPDAGDSLPPVQSTAGDSLLPGQSTADDSLPLTDQSDAVQ